MLLLSLSLSYSVEKNTLATVVANGETHSEIEEKDMGSLERPYELREDRLGTHNISHSANFNQQVSNPFRGKLVDTFREIVNRLCTSLKSQGNLFIVLVIIFSVILLMQV